MPDPVFLSLNSQHTYSIVVRSIFACSMLLHATSLVFLIKFTPKNQITWRNHPESLKVWLLAKDVYLEVLLEPVVLYPVFVGYTHGLLCRLRLPIQLQAGIGMLLYPGSGSAMVLCVLHKHQSILVGPSRFRLSQV
ncbi:hypothetical protein PENTCL1PPCAC_10084, partial [Pristionchus entomophagus]